MYKKSEKAALYALIYELKSLRKGAGATLLKISDSPTLRSSVAEQTNTQPDLLTPEQLRDYLQNETEKLGMTPEGQALRNALAFDGDGVSQLMLRRSRFSKTFGKHTDTIELYENKAISEIAERLLRPASLISSEIQPTASPEATPGLSSYQVAQNMLVQGLGDMFQLGQHASEIMRLLGPGETPHLNADIEIQLGPSKSREEWYSFTFRYAFQAPITSFRIAVVSSSYDSDILMASKNIDDVIQLDANPDYETALPLILNNSYFLSTKDGMQHKLHFRELSPQQRRELLTTVWQVDAADCRIIEVTIPEQLRGADVLHEHHRYFELDSRAGRYIFWNAPRLTYLNNVSVDMSRFPEREKWDFYGYSFLGPTFPGAISPSSDRYTVSAHSWITRGHGIMLLWQEKSASA